MAGQSFYFKRSRGAPARVKRARTAGIARVQRAVKKDEARAAAKPPCGAERAVLTKVVTVNDSSMTLYSFDGRLWASRSQDLVEIERRIEREILDAKRILIESYGQRF